MQPVVAEWLSMLLRWLHVVAGMAWIGSSFYFIHLDASLRRSGSLPAGVGGEAWQVHGGGFYRIQKYLVAPAELPEHLTWFKYEAYSTWLSGFVLLGLIYYLSADLYLIDPAVMDLPVWGAILISAASLALGWLVYDLLCKSRLGANTALLCALGFVFREAKDALVNTEVLFRLLRQVPEIHDRPDAPPLAADAEKQQSSPVAVTTRTIRWTDVACSPRDPSACTTGCWPPSSRAVRAPPSRPPAARPSFPTKNSAWTTA